MRFPPLYAIVDADVAAGAGWTVGDLARAYLAGGARLLQLRAKRMGSRDLLALADALVADAAPHGARVIVNDRADVARLASAAGVHVGQEDLPPPNVRALLGSEAIVGISTHTRAQVDAAAREPVSYLAVGPVFSTDTKATGYEAVGLDLVRYAARPLPGDLVPLIASGQRPIVAIGGITLDRARSVVEAGATAVAVITDLLATGDPEGRVRAYLERLGP